ncbi:phosphonate metabolism protein/1,5-bisphosphokinase (PRPP-forming) PhnN [Achromobacter sp. F4_2707]|uniref:phosphonate metabolism protein/1,5-bisphosphokinase (PRPP-forming) PhnN n=1 Tax=Achromobacter sp. F4_2707 TaxID=3114286 RepID=UPI0039C63108
MTGRLIYLMGPSGAGKDTVLQGVARLLGEKAYLAPRLVTRPPTHTERSALAVSESEFLRLERNGALALAWRANGLAYGVRADINLRLAVGCDVLVNGSRAYLPEARERYPAMVPVLLTVDQETLRQRLLARGRESPEQIHERMTRNLFYEKLENLEAAGRPLVIDNSGPVEQAILTLYRYLTSTPVSSPTPTETQAPYVADSLRYG